MGTADKPFTPYGAGKKNVALFYHRHARGTGVLTATRDSLSESVPRECPPVPGASAENAEPRSPDGPNAPSSGQKCLSRAHLNRADGTLKNAGSAPRRSGSRGGTEDCSWQALSAS